ncbi:MAG: DEAD/DEAH box helicase [Sphingobacteriaceae bacterium]|nr:MAG: DEAD/DEAH box helicase [Sphingobacteriaceae bacterium]
MQRKDVFRLTDLANKFRLAVGISNEMTIEKRNDSMKKFKGGDANTLICTNICSRSVNLGVDLVVNYDTPVMVGGQFDPKVYTYRVSRTGRFGKPGVAVTFNSGCASNIPNVLMRDYGIRMCHI